MRKAENKDSRMTALAKLWMQPGCPEKMTIHVKSTGETITLIDRMPVTHDAKGQPVRDNALSRPIKTRVPEGQKRELIVRQPVRDNRVCLACKNGFYSKRESAKYCSQRCQKRDKRKQEAQNQRAEHERLLAAS